MLSHVHSLSLFLSPFLKCAINFLISTARLRLTGHFKWTFVPLDFSPFLQDIWGVLNSSFFLLLHLFHHLEWWLISLPFCQMLDSELSFHFMALSSQFFSTCMITSHISRQIQNLTCRLSIFCHKLLNQELNNSLGSKVASS